MNLNRSVSISVGRLALAGCAVLAWKMHRAAIEKTAHLSYLNGRMKGSADVLRASTTWRPL